MKCLCLIFTLMLGGAAQAQAQDCKGCMAECPHQTRDLKACDRGCPGVCDRKKCTACMAECPHQTRDLKQCDQGCPKYCAGKPGRCSPAGKTAFDSACSTFTSEEECVSGKDGTSCGWDAGASQKTDRSDAFGGSAR